MELYAIVDTETTNGYLDANGHPCLDDSLVYDIAIAIIDERGKVYDTRRYVCDEIFNSPLMLSAYFADKIPEYIEMVNNREMVVLPFMEIYADARKFLARYNVCGIMAHNAKFDYRALNNTLRYLSGSKRRFFFPYGLPIIDTQKMAHNTICKQKEYISYCIAHGYMTKHNIPRPRETAEILYRYITGNDAFVEVHRGYDDIMIEKEIFVKCAEMYRHGHEVLDLYDAMLYNDSRKDVIA